MGGGVSVGIAQGGIDEGGVVGGWTTVGSPIGCVIGDQVG